jgi:hypothetical protein
MRLAAVVGARPNFVKIAPILAELRQYPETEVTLIHTGQHYDLQMSESFFANLEIPKPDVNLEARAETPSGRPPRSCGGWSPCSSSAARTGWWWWEMSTRPSPRP